MTLTEQAIAAIAAGCEGVTWHVKPLEWDGLTATSIVGTYEVHQDDSYDDSCLVWIDSEQTDCERQPDITAGRAAAQDDYEAKINTTLIVTPDPATALALCALAQEALQSRREGQQMREATIEECAKVADDWLANFGERGAILRHTSPQQWANDAVADIAETIRAISHPKPESVKS